MNASKEYGKKRGADFIRTQVFPQNADGIRFYEKNGFREMMKTIECQFGQTVINQKVFSEKSAKRDQFGVLPLDYECNDYIDEYRGGGSV